MSEHVWNQASNTGRRPNGKDGALPVEDDDDCLPEGSPSSQPPYGEFVYVSSKVSDKIDHPREERVDGTRQDVGTFGRVGGAGVDGRGDAQGEERKAERRRGKKARGEGAG